MINDVDNRHEPAKSPENLSEVIISDKNNELVKNIPTSPTSGTIVFQSNLTNNIINVSNKNHHYKEKLGIVIIGKNDLC